MRWAEHYLELSHGNNKPLKAMEGLRGIATFLVFLTHYCGLSAPLILPGSYTAHVMDFVETMGHIGVDLFFVLSGYLIYGSLLSKERTDFYPYLRRRIVRIYPTFLVMFLLYIVLCILVPSESKLPPEPAEAALYLLQNVLLLPGIFSIEPLITVAWSLSYEFLYYILIPLVIALGCMRRRCLKVRLASWLLMTGTGFLFFAIFGGHDRLLMFTAGTALYEVVSNNLFRLPKYSGSLCLLLAAIVYPIMVAYGLFGVSTSAVLFVLFFGLCMEALQDTDGTAHWLIFAPLRRFGNMSYSYYLMHGLTLKAAFFVFPLVLPAESTYTFVFWWAWIPLFAFTFVTSFILFITVEKPFSLSNTKTGRQGSAALVQQNAPVAQPHRRIADAPAGSMEGRAFF